MCDNVSVTDDGGLRSAVIILGVLLAVFVNGFITAVINIIYLKRKQGTLRRRFRQPFKVLRDTLCLVIVFYLASTSICVTSSFFLSSSCTCITGAALLENSEASAKLTTANGGLAERLLRAQPD